MGYRVDDKIVLRDATKSFKDARDVQIRDLRCREASERLSLGAVDVAVLYRHNALCVYRLTVLSIPTRCKCSFLIYVAELIFLPPTNISKARACGCQRSTGRQ